MPVRLFAHPEISTADALEGYDKVAPRINEKLNARTDLKDRLFENIAPQLTIKPLSKIELVIKNRVSRFTFWGFRLGGR